MALQILYEDAHVVVVDKPSGMLSVPGRRLENHHSAASWLQARYGEIHVVHRLDMDTKNNWGNSIVIKHAEFLYSHLSHIRKG
ncbi:MAG TPA: hypothetical protein EYP05_02155, partial [Piscirickettsiaceae bacterium]|nr:hypothetical protein [Piscirickettsiaceae bacterium]